MPCSLPLFPPQAKRGVPSAALAGVSQTAMHLCHVLFPEGEERGAQRSVGGVSQTAMRLRHVLFPSFRRRRREGCPAKRWRGESKPTRNFFLVILTVHNKATL